MALQAVEPGIYRRRSGRRGYVVPVYDGVIGKRRWSHPDMPRGGFERLQDARAFKLGQEMAKARPGSTVTCDAFALSWPKRNPQWDESTATNAERMLRRFCRDFEGTQMRDVGRRLARLYVHGGPVPPEYAKLAQRWKGTRFEDGVMIAVAHQSGYSQIRAMWNRAVDDEHISTNPFAALGVGVGRGRADAVMLTDAELQLLIHCAGEELGDYGRLVVGPMIATSAGTGMRPGELFAMRWHWIDWEAEEIQVKQQLQHRTGRYTLPKKGRRRSVPLLPTVREALAVAENLRDIGSDLVWHTAQGRPVKHGAFGRNWRLVRASFHAQLPQHRQDEIHPTFSLYELRHWFGSHLAALRGPHGEVLVSPQDIAKVMGHKDGGALAMRLYIHTAERDAGQRIAAAVKTSQAVTASESAGTVLRSGAL